MIVSYVNVLKAATLAATNEDINSPVNNLIHNYLELPFFADTDNSVITITLDVVSDIDHIAFDYHNLDTMVVRFYDVFAVLIDTQPIAVEENCNFHTFTTVEDVKTITITIDTLAALLYCGGISMGEYFTFPRFQQTLQGEILIFDNAFISGGGQASGNKKRNLDGYGLNFANITNIERTNIKTYLNYVGTVMPHFIDFYENGHENFTPFYGVQVKKPVLMPKRRISTWKFDCSLAYQEVR